MEIRILDKTFVSVHILEKFDSLVWNERYNKFGDFELVLDAGSDAVPFLKVDYYLRIPKSKRMMIIESFEIDSDVETGDKLIIKGRSLESILDRRVVFQRTIFDNVSLQTAIETLLDENGINSPGQPSRDIPGLIFLPSTDPLVTSPTLTAQYYTEEIYETIQFLCAKVNLGFRLFLNDSNMFEFALYAGADRSYNQTGNPYVVFSPSFNNLKSSKYLYTKRFKKTIALISGDAYHIDPRPTIDFDPWENDPNDPNYGTIRTGLDRRELFVDAPDLNLIDPNTGNPFTNPTGTNIMYERARQELNKNTEFESFDGEVDFDSMQYQYQTDFFLGDIVQLSDKYGKGGTRRITEVLISEDLSGSYIYPTFEIVE